MVKNPLANAGDIRDAGSIPGSGRFSGGRNGNPLQCSCWENPPGHRILVVYSPWGHTELDTTEADLACMLCITQGTILNSLQ